MATRKESWTEFPGVPAAIMLLLLLVVAWPAVLLHGNARWIGEGLWVGIPGLIVVIAVTANRYAHRDERKLKMLREDRLWAEGKHPEQLRAQEERLKLLAEAQIRAEKKRAAEQRRQAAEQRRQWFRDEIKREERLRDERRRAARQTP